MKLLRVNSMDELHQLTNGMRKEREEMISTVTYLMWHMRGGLSREDAWMLSVQERNIMKKQIDERIKMTKESKMPLI